jgi:hypothetical protein
LPLLCWAVIIRIPGHCVFDFFFHIVAMEQQLQGGRGD